MDKVVAFFNNKWLRRGVSLLSLFYPAFLLFCARTLMLFFIEPTHVGAFYTLYIFINVIFGGIMFFTRKQFVTELCTMVAPFIAFCIMLLGFGNWFIVIPPIIVCVVIFIFCAANETTKMVLGTIYLIMYVVGVLVYLTFQMLFGNISLIDVDLSTRSTTYTYSPDEKYRIVTYVEPEKANNRTVSFYLEKTDGDMSLPFAECRKVVGCIHLITSGYDKPAKLEWKERNTLYIDGRLREYNFNNTDSDDDIFGLIFGIFAEDNDADSDDESSSDGKTSSGNVFINPSHGGESSSSGSEGSSGEEESSSDTGSAEDEDSAAEA